MGLFAKINGAPDQQTKTRTHAKANGKSTYRGVQIMADRSECCEAVKAIASQRFLSADAPKLPLNACDAANCRCTYQHYVDRRTDLRRASDTGFDIASQFCKEDHRSGSSSGRRGDD